MIRNTRVTSSLTLATLALFLLAWSCTNAKAGELPADVRGTWCYDYTYQGYIQISYPAKHCTTGWLKVWSNGFATGGDSDDLDRHCTLKSKRGNRTLYRCNMGGGHDKARPFIDSRARYLLSVQNGVLSLGEW